MFKIPERSDSRIFPYFLRTFSHPKPNYFLVCSQLLSEGKPTASTLYCVTTEIRPQNSVNQYYSKTSATIHTNSNPEKTTGNVTMEQDFNI